VIYATTMENGTPSYYPGGLGANTAQGHQNNNRLIKIVDTGANPATLTSPRPWLSPPVPTNSSAALILRRTSGL